MCVLPFSLSTRRVPGICLSLLKCDFLIINCRCCKKKPMTDNNSFRFTVSKSLFTKSQREPEYQAKPWRLMVYAVADIQSSPVEPEMLRLWRLLFSNTIDFNCRLFLCFMEFGSKKAATEGDISYGWLPH